MRKGLFYASILAMVFCSAALGEEQIGSLTYACFPYLPDTGYYQDLIEARWAELEPDIRLIRADWDCYEDGKPEGIDVLMYDAVMRDTLIANGWIGPIEPEDVQESGDIFPFALEGITVQDELYGIPVFLCGNFLIYDRDEEALAKALHITDLAQESQILVMNTDSPTNRHQYALEAIADRRQEANPVLDDSAEDILELIDRLAIEEHKRDEDDQVALAYDAGAGQGYIGFSESMILLENRIDQTGIKAISFSDRENLPRVYLDAVALAAGVEGERAEKCLELMNVMAEAGVLRALSVREGQPQYLLLAKESVYPPLAELFPLYLQLQDLAGQDDNQVILTP